MSRNPEIEISDMCYETYPCKHEVKIKYPDGKVVEELLGALQIIKFHKDHSIKAPPHFDYLQEIIPQE